MTAVCSTLDEIDVRIMEAASGRAEMQSWDDSATRLPDWSAVTAILATLPSGACGAVLGGIGTFGCRTQNDNPYPALRVVVAFVRQSSYIGFAHAGQYRADHAIIAAAPNLIGGWGMAPVIREQVAGREE